MSASSGEAVEAQVQQLLQVVARHRDARCRELFAQARRDAEQVIRQAHAEARSRMHQSIQGIRETRRQRLVASEAQRQTHRRCHRQEADQRLLAAAWPPLRKALAARWSHEPVRQQWIDLLIRQACTLLLSPDWEIEHPRDWPEQERAALQERLARLLGRPPEFVAREGIGAGLRISANGTCIDGTLAGLLRDQVRIESRLLARFNASVTTEA
jgi:hypothetical protein